MQLAGWEIYLSAYARPSGGPRTACWVCRQAGGKVLQLYLRVPWLFDITVTFYKEMRVPVPMMFVDVDGTVAVPKSLGKNAPGAVLDTLIKIAEDRHWECGVGVRSSDEEY